MMTVKQVADRLQVSAQNIYGLIASGRLAAHRIGKGRGAIRVSDQDLSSYLESCRQQPTDQQNTRPRKRRLKHLKLS